MTNKVVQSNSGGVRLTRGYVNVPLTHLLKQVNLDMRQVRQALESSECSKAAGLLRPQSLQELGSGAAHLRDRLECLAASHATGSTELAVVLDELKAYLNSAETFVGVFNEISLDTHEDLTW